MSNLVIVESPAKAKTIQKYLGKGYDVIASMGHIRDLPKSKLGVDVENGFQPKYTDMKGKEGNLILIDIHMKALHQLHSDKNGDIINCRTAGLNSIHHGILCVGIIADTKQKIF